MIRYTDLRLGTNEDNTTFILSCGGDPIAQLDSETPISRLDALRIMLSGTPAHLTWENSR